MGQFEQPEIASVTQLIALAQRLENQAAENYDRLADEMRQHHNLDTANLFAKLADEERVHENAVAKIGQKLDSNNQDQLWVFPAEMTLHHDKTRNNAGDPFLLTPYNAICFALYNEGITFELFTQIAALTDDDMIRAMAESFAKEELAHIASLRLARLDASRNLRELRDTLGWWDDIEEIKSEHDFFNALGQMEATTTQIYKDAALRLTDMGDLDNSRFFNMLADRVKESALTLNVKNITTQPYTLKGEETPAAVLLACLKYTDQTLDYVTFIAEKAVSDEIYTQASNMSERLARRLNGIRERLSILFAD